MQKIIQLDFQVRVGQKNLTPTPPKTLTPYDPTNLHRIT